jgi:hypothetical protein
MAYAGGYPVKKGVEYLFVFEIRDCRGNLVTTAAGLSATVSKDGASPVASTNSVAEIGGGLYSLTLTATEMNANIIGIVVTTTTTTNYGPLPRYGVAYLLEFPIVDNDGDPVTGAAGLDSEIAKDDGNYADCTNEAAEKDTTSGTYQITLTAAEMTATKVAVQTKTSTTDAKTTVTILETSPNESIPGVSEILYTSSITVDTVITTILANQTTLLTNQTTIINYLSGGSVVVVPGTGLGAIYYTLSEMLDELGIYLSDLNQADNEPLEFQEKLKVVALNRAQDEVLKRLKNEYVVDLYEVAESNALTSDRFDITTLSSPIFHKGKGLMGVRIHDYKFCYKLNFGEYRLAKTNEREFTREEAVCYQRGNYIYVEGQNSSDTIDLHYIREPVKMALAVFGDHDDDSSCELEQGLQDIIISYAAYILFRYGGDRARMRAKIAFDDAMMKIASANESIPASDATRVPEGPRMTKAGGAFNILTGKTR